MLHGWKEDSNQIKIKSIVDLVRLLQLERRRITLFRLVRSLELVTVGSPEKECFQAGWKGEEIKYRSRNACRAVVMTTMLLMLM